MTDAHVHARSVATLPADGVGGYAIAALDEQRVAVAALVTSGTAYCPDCVGLDPAQCPAACVRSTVSVSLQTVDGAATARVSVATVFAPSSDQDVSSIAAVALDGERIGVAWLECDDSSCMGLFQKQSCTARYTTVDLGSGTVGATQTLYQRWFGDLTLAFEPSTHQLLAVVGKVEAFGVGVRRAIFDESGATLVAPWAPLGGRAARSAAALAAGGRFVIAFDDRSPSQAAPEPPCAASCDCLAAGGAELDSGGLFAATVGDGADDTVRVALGRGDDGFYRSRERIAAIDTGGRLAIADTQSIDRSAEIFTRDGAEWTRRLQSKAPLPTWIGALGAGDGLAWLGSDVEPGQPATVQRLVAGTAIGSDVARTTLDDPLERNVFAAAPVTTSSGVHRTFLLQGVFGHVGGAPVWDRFELLAVDLD